MIDRNELLDALENVHEFLKEIDDPGHKAVAMAAAYIAGELNLDGLARPMTLEEVRECKGFLWLETAAPYTYDHQGHLYKAILVRKGLANGMLTFHARRVPNNVSKTSAVYYGVACRCWASKPTAEDMAAAEWEVDGDG